MLTLITLILLPPLHLVISSLISLRRNILILQRHNIPCIAVPVDPVTPLGQTFSQPLYRLLCRLPSSLRPRCTPYLQRGWHFADKCDSLKQVGPVWGVASPSGLHVQVADGRAGKEVLERRDKGQEGGGFVRADDNYQLLAAFGPSLLTADNVNWPRHRRVLAAPFSERIMETVWEESLSQTVGLVGTWRGVLEVTHPATDLRTVSLNVLAGAGFKKDVMFRGVQSKLRDKDETEGAAYRDALRTVLDNIILIMVVGHRWLRMAFWSEWMQNIGVAAKTFEQHMAGLLDEEEQALREGEKGAGGIMTAFVKAMQTGAKEPRGKMKTGLTREEVFGNIFITSFAGHDTTANTLSFAVLLLTAYPEVQDWVTEEIVHWTGGKDKDWGYGNLFPKLNRCRAIMRETLRLYPPVMSIPKRTRSQAQTVNLGTKGRDGDQVTIPPNTIVNVLALAVQTNADEWGDDALIWRPSRWVRPSADGGHVESESLVEPKKGNFLAWSDGPQNCLGAKFSEVEFVAVIAYLLSESRLEALVAEPRQVLNVVNDADMQMLLKMKDGNAVKVRLRRRPNK